MNKYQDLIKKTLLGSLFTFVPLFFIWLLKLKVDSQSFYYFLIFSNLIVSPFWIKFIFAIPKDRTEINFGKANFLYTGLIKYILVPPITMLLMFLVYLGADYLNTGNGFDTWIFGVIFINSLLAQIAIKLSVPKNGRHVKKI